METSQYEAGTHTTGLLRTFCLGVRILRCEREDEQVTCSNPNTPPVKPLEWQSKDVPGASCSVLAWSAAALACL